MVKRSGRLSYLAGTIPDLRPFQTLSHRQRWLRIASSPRGCSQLSSHQDSWLPHLEASMPLLGMLQASEILSECCILAAQDDCTS